MLLAKKHRILASLSGGAPILPFGKVQSTIPVVVTSSVPSAATTFATLPNVGSGLVVVVLAQTNNTADTCADNRSNTYVVSRVQPGPGAGFVVMIFHCAKLINVTAPLTVTVSGASRARYMQIIEVGGVGAGLTVDQSTSREQGAASWSTLNTSPLTAVESFQVGAITLGGAGISGITVNAATPVWTQESERLSPVPIGEINTRLVTNALGTTPNIAWTGGGGGFNGLPTLVAYKAS